MNVIAPPPTTQPQPDELEALIKEARERQLRRRLLGAAAVAIVAAIGLTAYALLIGGNPVDLAPGPANAGRASGPLCRASQLSAVVALQGATQSMLGGATITNTSRATCSLPARRPRVRVSWGSRPMGVREQRWPYKPSLFRMPAHVLGAGDKATIYMQWWSWCGKVSGGSMRSNLRFELTFNGGPHLPASLGSTIGMPLCVFPSRGSYIYVSAPYQSQ